MEEMGSGRLLPLEAMKRHKAYCRTDDLLEDSVMEPAHRH